MKRWLILAVFLLAVCLPLSAQNQTFPTLSTAGGAFTVSTAALTGGAIPLINSDVHYHTLTWYVTSAAPSGCTVVLESSTSGLVGGTWTSLISGQTCTSTGETTTATAGDVNYVRIRASTYTGAGTQALVMYKGYTANPYGSLAIAAGAGPVIVVNGALTTAYAGTAGMTVITSGSTSQMTGTTTNVPSIECNNISAAGANTVTIMDGNGKYFLGPNYSIPASSNQVMNWNGGARFTSGINISAGAANVIQCEVSPGSTQ